MQKTKVVKKFSSSLDDSIILVEVLDMRHDFIVRVLGEPDIAFPDVQEALNYAEQKAGEF